MKSPQMLCLPCSQLGSVSHSLQPCKCWARGHQGLGTWGWCSSFPKELFPGA